MATDTPPARRLVICRAGSAALDGGVVLEARAGDSVWPIGRLVVLP